MNSATWPRQKAYKRLILEASSLSVFKKKKLKNPAGVFYWIYFFCNLMAILEKNTFYLFKWTLSGQGRMPQRVVMTVKLHVWAHIPLNLIHIACCNLITIVDITAWLRKEKKHCLQLARHSFLHCSLGAALFGTGQTPSVSDWRTFFFPPARAFFCFNH